MPMQAAPRRERIASRSSTALLVLGRDSAGQKNDWAWFKEAWDKEMVNQHGANWPSVFARWMQNVVDDECSNAFSKFVYNETCRVFHGTVALHVPGG